MDDEFSFSNRSIEEIQRHICEAHETESDSDELYCPQSWDTVSCWPRTKAGVVAVLPCFEELSGIKYDTSGLLKERYWEETAKELCNENATRQCLDNGTWFKFSNYNSCQPLPAAMHPFDHADEDMSTLYLVGYSLSLVALCIAVWIFLYFKDLRCLRNTIHTHLMFTFMLTDFTWIVTLTHQLAAPQTNTVSCVIFITLLHYFLLTNYFWTFVEGLYLYMLVVQTFSGEKIKLRYYVIIGWGTPVVIILVWATVKSLGPELNTQITSEEVDCPWMVKNLYDWIFMGPVLTMLAVNVIFLIKIMWVLITKLRSANTVETKQYRKATKALLVLIPLLGVTYILTIVGPSGGIMAKMFEYTRATLLSTQGLIVTMFYCFLNTEVQNTVRHHFDSWKTERSLTGSRRYHYSCKDWSPRSRAESMRLCAQPSSRYGKRESTVSETTTTTLVGGSANNGSITSTTTVKISAATAYLYSENAV